MKILVVEDEPVLEMIEKLLMEIWQEHDYPSMTIIATSDTSTARNRLSEADAIIIDISSGDRLKLAHAAMNISKIPVIATTDLPESETRMVERKNLRFIHKPEFNLRKFVQAVINFVDGTSVETPVINKLAHRLTSQRSSLN